MHSQHRVVAADARSLDLPDESVELAVTSPPYPMIEMWDETFRELDPAVGAALDAGDGDTAFRRMHAILDDVWAEVARVLAPGGIACVNVGDATRTVGDDFRVYPNHTAVVDAFRALGFDTLPDVLWRKPTNSATKFMGSGMLPPNAYVTLEHEFVLVFRKPGMRSPPSDLRRRSAYFWEERNEWFSDVWEFHGENQTLEAGTRDRTGAFPFELPHRLINMYSVQGDLVLDPFWGTGTTTIAAMCAGRSSVGVELDESLVREFDPDLVSDLSREVSEDRLAAHREFVCSRDEPPGYEATHYDTRVVTKQERDVRLPIATSVDRAVADGANDTTEAGSDSESGVHDESGSDGESGADGDTGWTVEHDWL